MSPVTESEGAGMGGGLGRQGTFDSLRTKVSRDDEAGGMGGAGLSGSGGVGRQSKLEGLRAAAVGLHVSVLFSFVALFLFLAFFQSRSHAASSRLCQDSRFIESIGRPEY